MRCGSPAPSATTFRRPWPSSRRTCPTCRSASTTSATELRRMKALLPLLLAAACSLASAQSVTLTGTIGSRAILIVDGAEPKTVAVGDTYKGVKLVSLQGERATIEAGG